MDNPNCSTEHRKWQHLTPEERYDIEVHLKDGWSCYKIACNNYTDESEQRGWTQSSHNRRDSPV
ncbi:MAG: helix-turn-helix domain-containing protein [Eubacteriales bacterium]|nr:helix-turn-helix domain-containing protein [Eubacteriales bacterium]